MVPPSVTWTVSYALAGSERRSRPRKSIERVRAARSGSRLDREGLSFGLDGGRPGRVPQLRPVDAPDAARADPDQGAASLGRRRQRQMVQVVDAGVETAGVRGLQEAETLPIEVMTELVQERVKQATIGSQLPEHGGAHPDPHPLLREVVVAEQLEVSALPDLPRPRPQHAQP